MLEQARTASALKKFAIRKVSASYKEAPVGDFVNVLEWEDEDHGNGEAIHQAPSCIT